MPYRWTELDKVLWQLEKRRREIATRIAELTQEDESLAKREITKMWSDAIEEWQSR